MPAHRKWEQEFVRTGTPKGYTLRAPRGGKRKQETPDPIDPWLAQLQPALLHRPCTSLLRAPWLTSMEILNERSRPRSKLPQGLCGAHYGEELADPVGIAQYSELGGRIHMEAIWTELEVSCQVGRPRLDYKKCRDRGEQSVG
ncbi:hypothetical protein BS47DRAFT_1368200 [Hydnum rufescens UP504]|uniref:Uncharacterized protein n=1 Tax=Hydnum rufescens UP504 TaxID=1448309 RepID=A0A9P6DNG6_9AGAM|nr:hypothetical protein BS47DRAFT_1368200 [Hydnum rufescens UP504]